MTTLKPNARMNLLPDRFVIPSENRNKHDRGTAIAFSGDLKHWRSKIKGKDLF